MAEPFSMVASSFAVVGLADVVLRAGDQIYQFLNAIKDAPAEIENLKSSIHENIVLVQYSKGYWEELRQLLSSLNPSTITSLSNTLPHLNSVLKALHRELSRLSTVIKRYKGPSKIWGNIRFVLDEQKIQRSLQRLEGLKLNFVVVLIYVTRSVI